MDDTFCNKSPTSIHEHQKTGIHSRCERRNIQFRFANSDFTKHPLEAAFEINDIFRRVKKSDELYLFVNVG